VPPRYRLSSGYSSPRFWRRAAIASLASLAAGAVFAFVVIQLGGWTHGLPFEVALLERTHARLPLLLDFTVVSLPWLGTNLVFIPVLGPACWYLWRKRVRPDLAVSIAVVTIGNYLIGTFLKFAFSRPRPTLWPPRGEFSESSYPSGHAMAIVSVVGIIAFMLHEERGAVWPFLAWLILLIATCYARLYLGVHWPTDVIGGLIVGVVWLAGMLWARRREPTSH
jgi:undecaprenyl-diphosphatase